MSSGYAASLATVVEFDGIEKLLPNESKAFVDAVNATNIEYSALVTEIARCIKMDDLSNFTQHLIDNNIVAQLDDDDGECLVVGEMYADEAGIEVTAEQIEAVIKAYDALVDAFQQFDLELRLSHHDISNEGDCYDEVDGYFWEVDGISLSPQALAIKKLGCDVEFKHFVTFG